MLLSKFVPYYCLQYIIPRILHIISNFELIFYADKIMLNTIISHSQNVN